MVISDSNMIYNYTQIRSLKIKVERIFPAAATRPSPPSRPSNSASVTLGRPLQSRPIHLPAVSRRCVVLRADPSVTFAPVTLPSRPFRADPGAPERDPGGPRRADGDPAGDALRADQVRRLSHERHSSK